MGVKWSGQLLDCLGGGAWESSRVTGVSRSCQAHQTDTETVSRSSGHMKDLYSWDRE